MKIFVESLTENGCVWLYSTDFTMIENLLTSSLKENEWMKCANTLLQGNWYEVFMVESDAIQHLFELLSTIGTLTILESRYAARRAFILDCLYLIEGEGK